MKKIATIVSNNNPVFKSARALHTRKGREKAGAFLVEGWKLIIEAQGAGFEIERVFIDAGALARGEAEQGQWRFETALEEKLFSSLAQTESPQPYIAVVRRAGSSAGIHGNEAARTGTPHPANKQAEPDRVLILDRIGDPGNAGTMIRTALAAGMDAVWCVKGTADVFSDKAIRASAGAVFHIRAEEGLSAEECIERARELSVRIFVCDAGGRSLYEEDLTGWIAVVVGNEANGPQQAFLDAAHTVVGIPMAKESESLNAGAAAAVVMYEALRQRME